MEKIYIRKKSDFSNLKRLPPKAHVRVILCNDERNISLSAVSLKGFEGFIEVSLVNPKGYYYYSVDLEEGKDAKLFFQDFQNAAIEIEDASHIHTKYFFHKTTYHVSSFSEWQEAIKSASYIEKADIYIQNDIVIPDYIPNNSGIILVHGNGHYLYGSTTCIQKLKDSKHIQFFSVSFYPVTQILKVKNPNDFKRILNFPNDTVAMTLENNITNQAFSPVDLSNFFGTLIFLGNGRKLANITLKDSDNNSLGLFSRISASASFICSDLTVRKLCFPAGQKDYVGCILGSRMKDNSSYPVFPGKTLFYQCTIENTKLPESTKKRGVFVGYADKFAECISCTHSHIHCGGHRPFGNQYYFDEQNFDYTKLVKDDLRICSGDPRKFKKDS